MTIKEFIARKPIHVKPHKLITPRTKKDEEEVVLRYDDPFRWCDADQNLLEDDVIYIEFDSETDNIESIIIEGEDVF